jgi:IclR family acetate operon transcriptional repressor
MCEKRNAISIIKMNGSVTRAVNLLEEMARNKKPVALKELARNTRLNKATAYRLLHSLWQKGLVQKIGDHGFYALGPKLLVLAEDYRQNFTMRDRVLPHLEQLVRVTGETAIYCERFQDDSCVTIERRESPHQTRTIIETGLPRPLYVGSSALVILAMLPQKEISSILSAAASDKAAPGGDLQKQIAKKIGEIRRQGYAVSIQERYSYTAGVAAPVFLESRVVGSLAVIGPTQRIKATGIETIGKAVRKIADHLSVELEDSTSGRVASSTGRLRLAR